ncbi:MAG: TraY domain-containing protein [Verrucomicrobiales bacterium]
MATVRLDSETEKRLEQLARKTGRTKSFYLRKALQEHLDDIEDYYLGMLALENTERTYTGEKAKRELGL